MTTDRGPCPGWRLSAVALTAGLLAGAAAGHETFVAAAGPATPGTSLSLRLTSTARFPRPETPIMPGRIARLTATTGDRQQAVAPGASAATWLTLQVTPASAGVMVVAVDLGPKAIALTPAKVSEYLAEIEAGAAVRVAYRALPSPRQWHEFYTKHAKALVCVAPCADTAAAQRPAGQALEFVAADAGLGRFVLLAAGTPLVGQPVQIVDAAGKVTRVTTGAGGSVALPAGVAAPLLLATTVLRPPAAPGEAFTSDFATLWLGARPAPGR